MPVDFHLTLVAQILCAKLIFVLEVWGLRESGIGIFLFVEHPISSVFNMQSVHVNVDFTLSLVTQTIRVKRFFFLNFQVFCKEATMLIGHPEKWSEFY